METPNGLMSWVEGCSDDSDKLYTLLPEVWEDCFRDFYGTEFYTPMPINRRWVLAAPRSLGFVDANPVFNLTQSGERLISGKRVYETITRQLLKFQLPSPYHKTNPDFFVKPYLEFLRLTRTVGSLSKAEIAMFFTQLVHINKFDEVVTMITDYRAAVKVQTGNRKAFTDVYFNEQLSRIYAEEIENKRFHIRENTGQSFKKFVKTKKENLVGYADAFVRYVRATELISFEKKTFRVIIAPSRTEDVDFILATVPREPTIFGTEREFKDYLFATDNINLLTDDRKLLTQRLDKLKAIYSPTATVDTLKDLLEITEDITRQNKIEETVKELKGFKEFDDIIDVFGQVQKKTVPDPPLFLEWNVWRSMVMLNYANVVQGNFVIDLDGFPLTTAGGNKPDIEIDYDEFKLIVEVTTSTGNKQYEMEGEPVARHFGKLQLATDKPVYCLFIANKISSGALAHFFNLNRMNTKAYGGRTRIIPMSVDQFKTMLRVAKEGIFDHSAILHNYLNALVEANQTAEDEDVWYEGINDSISSWV